MFHRRTLCERKEPDADIACKICLDDWSAMMGQREVSTPMSAGETLAILEAVPGNYLILQPDPPNFTIVAVSDAYAAATNTVRERILGHAVFEIFPDNPNDPGATSVENLTASFMYVLEHKIPHRLANLKYDIPRPDGGPFEERYWSPLNCPVLDNDGNVTHIVHAAVDITQNIHMEEREQHAILQLDAERRRLYDLITQLPGYVALLGGPDLVVEAVNQGALDLWGKTADQAIGKPFAVTFSAANEQGFGTLLSDVFTTGVPFVGESLPVVSDARGATIYCDVVFNPFVSHSGQIEGVVGFGFDVTPQVIAKERLAELAKQKDEFLGIVSHELKTPLTSVKAYTQVLQNRFAKAGDADSAALLAKMDAQLNKLSDLIGDLLDVTRLEAGNLLLQEYAFNFNDLVAEVVEEMQRTTERHEIVTDLAEPRTIVGDRDRTGQVLTNFLSNAIKYSPDADKVLVTTTTTQTTATACVQDFGIGILKGMQDQIFERFYRANGSTLDTYPGIGLGLYISAEIVRRLQGRIWVESEIGEGSTFCFELPLNRDSKAVDRIEQ